MMTLEADSALHDVYATSLSTNTSNFEERRADAKKIGELVLTSEFVASEFGDSQLFFRHQRVED